MVCNCSKTAITKAMVGDRPIKTILDFIVQIEDGRSDLLNLIAETKGARGEDAKEKASTIHPYWTPGVNNLSSFGRWEFAEFTAVFEIEAEFNQLIECLIQPTFN